MLRGGAVLPNEDGGVEGEQQVAAVRRKAYAAEGDLQWCEGAGSAFGKCLEAAAGVDTQKLSLLGR